MSRIAVVCIAIALMCVQGINAWGCTAHMIVAEIAQTQLKSQTRGRISELMKWLSKTGPFPKIPDMVQGACWSSDLLENNAIFSQWHYMYDPYSPDGTAFDKCAFQRNNISSVTMAMDNGMKPGIYENRWNLAFALASYIHYLGDLHQPLHNIELFSNQFPHGDRGGVNFDVFFNGRPTNLHEFWDTVCGQFEMDPARPLNSSAAGDIQKKASDLIAKYKFPRSLINVYNTRVIHSESFNFAVNTSYSELQPGAHLTSTYIQSCITTAERRITLAGYRLAYELDYLIKSTKRIPSQSSRIL